MLLGRRRLIAGFLLLSFLASVRNPCFGAEFQEQPSRKSWTFALEALATGFLGAFANEGVDGLGGIGLRFQRMSRPGFGISIPVDLMVLSRHLKCLSGGVQMVLQRLGNDGPAYEFQIGPEVGGYIYHKHNVEKTNSGELTWDTVAPAFVAFARMGAGIIWKNGLVVETSLQLGGVYVQPDLAPMAGLQVGFGYRF